MKIGELAAETGVSRDTIRFYEKQGLLSEISRPYESNTYKDYGAENVKRIELILAMKKFGFTLVECGEVIDALTTGVFSLEKQKDLIAEKITKIDDQIAELSKLKNILQETIQTGCDGPMELIQELDKNPEPSIIS